jgi:methylaspartate ammonia-lyase
MTDSPTISALLTVPTLAANGRSQLTVGLQLSDGQRFWADCVDVPAASRLEETAVFDPQQAASQVHNLVQPLWRGQPVTAFRPLAQMLLALKEPFSYTRTIPPEPQPATGTVSRRSLITGFWAETEGPEPRLEEVIIERPLHPALQYGLTAALLPAVAAVNRESVAALVAREYEVALAETAVPLQITLDDKTMQTARTILTTHVASLGYTTSKNNHKATLGANGEQLQKHIRQVAAWLPTVDAAFQPALHLDLRDSFRELFDNDEGKVLGALVGLEQAAKPFILHVQNPVWHDSREAQLNSLEKLQGYLTFRGLKLKLVADAWVDSLADVTDFTNPDVCHMVHVELPRLGNLEAGITAVLHLKSPNQSVILSGENSPLTTHIALSTQPPFLTGSPRLHYNEMQKILKVF